MVALCLCDVLWALFVTSSGLIEIPRIHGHDRLRSMTSSSGVSSHEGTGTTNCPMTTVQ